MFKDSLEKLFKDKTQGNFLPLPKAFALFLHPSFLPGGQHEV